MINLFFGLTLGPKHIFIVSLFYHKSQDGRHLTYLQVKSGRHSIYTKHMNMMKAWWNIMYPNLVLNALYNLICPINRLTSLVLDSHLKMLFVAL